MAKVTDYNPSSEVTDIMSKFAEKMPGVFGHFDVSKIGCVHTHNKDDARNPLKLRAITYPLDVWLPKVYIVEVAQNTWDEMNDRQKNLSVFHTMCAIPEGGFDEQSSTYAKKKKPDYEIYAEEFAITGGIPNWMENEEAKDPLEDKKKVSRRPIRAEDVASVIA